MKKNFFHPPALQRCFALGSVLALGLALPVNGQIVEFTFLGALTDVVDSGTVLSDLGLMIGTPFTGAIRYDVAQVTFDGFNGTQPNAASWHFAPAQYTLTLTLAGHTFASRLTDAAHDLSIENDLGIDRLSYSFDSLNLDGNVMPDSTAFVFLTDNSQTALTGKALPVVAPLFNDFPNQRLLHVDLANGLISFTGNLTSFAAIPEAKGGATLVGLMGISLYVSWRSRRNRVIVNSGS